MHPSLALLYTDGPPFLFGHKMGPWHQFDKIFGQYDVSETQRTSRKNILRVCVCVCAAELRDESNDDDGF